MHYAEIPDYLPVVLPLAGANNQNSLSMEINSLLHLQITLLNNIPAIRY